MSKISIPSPGKREFLPMEYRLTGWSRLKPYFNELLRRSIASPSDWQQWLNHRDEIDCFLAEEWQARWQRLNQEPDEEMTRAAFSYIAEQIIPKVWIIGEELDKKAQERIWSTTASFQPFGQQLKNAMAYS